MCAHLLPENDIAIKKYLCLYKDILSYDIIQNSTALEYKNNELSTVNHREKDQLKNESTSILFGRNQIFTVGKDDKKSQMRDLMLNISYFEISSATKFIPQRYDKEWDTYIDLGEENVLEDRDKLQVMIISECTQIACKSKESEMMVIYIDCNVHVHNKHSYF